MARFENVDLDSIVDYKAEYLAVVEKARISGDDLTGLCPFHKDRNNSFSANLKTGQWNCFSEGISGNFISFWARYRFGSDDENTRKEAYKEILERYHVSREPERRAPDRKKAGSGSGLESYTLEQYSADKKIPVDFLRDVCKVETGTDRSDGTRYVKTVYASPYQDAIFRKRYGRKVFKWGYGAKGKLCLYGEWRIEEFQRDGWAVLVEGESDTQSLWYMGIPAIGVAGATNFKAGQAKLLQGLKLYIHKEPDGGGETFVNKVCRNLKDGGYTGDVCIWSCGQLGVKDPSDLFMEKGREEAARLIRDSLAATKPIDINQMLMPEAIPGAPLNLRQPEGWMYSDHGVSAIDQKTDALVTVCRTPIILTQRLKSLETGDEKMEIAFKRDDQWHTAIYPRSTIFSSRSITTLADLGCTITSENARKVVQFLGALEAENIDLIPKNDSTGTFGWQPGKRFLPGHADGITLDIDPSQRGMAAAYCTAGSFDRWIEQMRPHRERERFRFILAASFAAPLLRIVKQRIFFVYNWGGSKGGKTAALKAALSAWGDPERLMVNFNATQVGLERTAAFYCDLPLGIDERQLAGNRQGELEKIVYMIASGKGKLRGAKGGGVQTTHGWRTVALATGEEPLSTDTSQTGVSTRVLEIYGGPFEDESSAGLMHQLSALNYGWAGPAFVERLLQMEESKIVDAFEEMRRYIQDNSDGKNGSHIAGIATVALADAMIDSWFFGGQWRESWDKARQMASTIMQTQVENNSTDVNENALQFVIDWVLSNKGQFGTKVIGTCLGFTSDTGNTAYIFPSMLNQALTKAGYSPRKTMKYLAEQGLIGSETDSKTGKKVYSVKRWFESRSTRFIEFRIGMVSEAKDPVDDAEETGSSNTSSGYRNEEWDQWSQQQFTELTDSDPDELPF